MKKILLFLFFLITAHISISQENYLQKSDIKTFNNNIRLNFIDVQLKNDPYATYDLAPYMGLIGLNYNYEINKYLYGQLGMHAAITGDQGGLFTLGAGIGVSLPVYKNLFFDSNFHFGGGGGYRILVNGGGMIYSNLGFKYKFKNFSLGLQYGYLDFFTGLIRDENFSIFVEIPTKITYLGYKSANSKYKFKKDSKKTWSKEGVKNVQQVTFDFFFPVGNSRTDSFQGNQSIRQTLYIIGFEYQKYINQNTFLYAHVDTMYKGLLSGFMDMFFGAGYNFVNTEYVNFFAKFGAGAAGGRIFQEGGATIYPNAGFDVRLSNKIGLSFHGGYHRAVNGTFEAYTAGASLKYYGLSGGTYNPKTKKEFDYIKTQGVQLSVQNQTYFDVAKFGIPSSDLQLIGIKINYDLTNKIYISGESGFAYLGKSGGYAHGLFGLGLKSNKFFNDKISFFGEGNFGVAGGGRVDSGEGVVIRPTLGTYYHINDDFAINLTGAWLYTPFGNVSSPNLNIGITYGLSILNPKNKKIK